MKPAATGIDPSDSMGLPEDLQFVADHTLLDSPDLRCPLQFRAPLAPWIAGRLEGKEIDPGRIFDAWNRLRETDEFSVVEGAGGVLVPLTENFLIIDLMGQMGLPALVVCRPALGTINHTLLTLEALVRRNIQVAGFVTSGRADLSDPAASTSPEAIEAFSDGIPYLGHVPPLDSASLDPKSPHFPWETFHRITSELSMSLTSVQSEENEQGS